MPKICPIVDAAHVILSYNTNMPNSALIDHIRAATTHKPRESQLFAAIIAQAIKDVDKTADDFPDDENYVTSMDYVKSDLFREHCYKAGLDYSHLLNLLRKYWIKPICPSGQEPTQATGDRAIALDK